MKKFYFILIAMTICLSIVACNKKENSTEVNTKNIEEYTEGFGKRFYEKVNENHRTIIRIADVNGNLFSEHTVYTKTGTKITFEAPNVDGYEFIGWYSYIGKCCDEKEFSFITNESHTYEAVYLKEAKRTIMYSKTSLNLRTSPEITETNRVTTVPANSEFVVLDYDKEHNWDLVEYNGSKYFVATEFLSSEKTVIKNPITISKVTYAEGTVWSKYGVVLNQDIANYLYEKLCENNIGWFMPYAVCIAFQESGFNPNAVSPDGKDRGLFQYRITYWDNGDIFNPYHQVDIFVSQMSNRANLGLTIEEMISRHNMSDWGAYNQKYVDQVLQHFEK